MGEDELGHRSCSEYMSIDFGPDGAGDGRFTEQPMMSAFSMVELGNFQDTTNMDWV